MSKAIRWSHNDRYFGPFTYAYEPRGRKIALMLGSGDGADYPGCRLRVAVGAHTLIVALPAVIKPWRRWHEITTEPTRTQMLQSGRQPGYWDQHEREFGFSVSEGSVHFHYGPQTHDSETSKSKVWFIPWKSVRLVRTSHYDLAGEHFVTIPPRGSRTKFGQAAWQNHWTVKQALQGACPTASFLFADFDGEQITATTRIDEAEWAKGEGKFKWLSLFCRNKVARTLDIRFAAEVGREKGSWKGGTIGSGIDMLPGELHEGAFKRYCGKNGLTFIGAAEQPAEEANPELPPQPPVAQGGDDELDRLRLDMRMIVSHATGGVSADVDRSVNDICVDISRNRNLVFAHGKEVGGKEAIQPSDGNVERFGLAIGAAIYGEGFDPHLNPEAFDFGCNAGRVALTALSTAAAQAENGSAS